MKKILLSFFALCMMVMSASAAKIYINPGHGSWHANCRNMLLVNIPRYNDTLGFYESNTNLWKGLFLEKKLLEKGYQVKMSRKYSGGTNELESSPYDKALHVIGAESQAYGSDYFISIHSNAHADGAVTNYPLFIHKGYDASESNSGSIWGERILWTHHYEIWVQGQEHNSYPNYNNNNKNIRGGLSMNGWDYGVLRTQYRPGTLVEGYFHTYQPGRHRAMQPDWCRQEGLRYFRGFTEMYGTAKDTKGYIMGYIRTKSKQINQTNYTGRSANDIYYPINGAKVVLRDAAGNVIKTDNHKYVARDFVNQDIYTTDDYYNGVFVYDNLTPGKYTVYVYANGYANYKADLTVSAHKTTYTQIFLTPGTGTAPDTAPMDPDTKWVLNGGKVPGGTVPSNEALWSDFMTYFNSYYPGGSADNTKTFPRATQEITGTTTFWPGGVDSKSNIFTNSNSKWKWLGDYIASVASAQGYALSDETAWRWHMHAFFNCHAGTFVVGDKTIKTANFTAAGKSSAWGRTYQIYAGTSMELPYRVTSTYTLPTPVNGDKIFVGWFDNAAGTGTAIKTIAAGQKITLYAIWKEGDPDVIWNLQGGKVPGGEIPTNAELWDSFKEYYQKFYNETRANQEITAVAVFMTQAQKIMTDGTSEYKWLGDYIAQVTTAAGRALDTEVLWRFAVQAFFNCSPAATSNYNGNADFTNAGKPAAWGPLYQAKYGAGVTLPIFITSEYTIPTPVRDGFVFQGWNTKADGSGTALTKLSVGYKGTVYAVWEAEKTTPVKWVLNGGTVTGTLPEEITAIYEIPTPTKANEIFVGWFDNAAGKGEALTKLTVSYEGTIYAVWRKPTIKWELNGGQVTEEKTVVGDVKVPTQEELWTKFKAAASVDGDLDDLGTLAELKALETPYVTFCGNSNLQVDNLTKVFAIAEWTWLRDYIMTTQNAQKGNPVPDNFTAAGVQRTVPELTTDIANEGANWRYAVAAFFLQSQHKGFPGTADFATAGKPEAWSDTYKKTHGGEPTTEVVPVELPVNITAVYKLPTPKKTGVTFVGWYNNANGEGSALTELPAYYDGTVYAIWSDNVKHDVIWQLNGGEATETLPNIIEEADYILPKATKAGCVFLGWYDNNNGEGDALTVLPIGYKGTVYAIWREAKVAWELNGGKVYKEVVVPGTDVKVPTQEELWTSFKAAASVDGDLDDLGTLAELKALETPYVTFCGNSNLQVDNLTKVFAIAEWTWLRDYIMTTQNAQKGNPVPDNFTAAGVQRTVPELTTDIANEGANWRYAVAAFFLQSQHKGFPGTADFATAGKPEAWGAAYTKAHGGNSTTKLEEITLPTAILNAPYTIPTPVKEGDTFVGWYNNANGTGEKLTVLPVGYDGTVYAIWTSMAPTNVENVRPALDVNAPMYDVLGRQVDATYRGIILQGGNKYLLR